MRMVELTAIDHKNQREMHLTGVIRVNVITTKSGYLCYNVTFIHAGETYQTNISTYIWDEIRLIHF